MSFIVSVLESLHISFAKIFCQNKIKKNCKSVPQISCKSAVAGCGRKCGRRVFLLNLWFIVCGAVNLLLHEICAVAVYKHQEQPENVTSFCYIPRMKACSR